MDLTVRDNKGDKKRNAEDWFVKDKKGVFFFKSVHVQGDIKHLPFLCPTREPILLSSATRTQKKNRLNHTVNGSCCYVKHGAASQMVIMVATGAGTRCKWLHVGVSDRGGRVRDKMRQSERGNEKEAEIWDNQKREGHCDCERKWQQIEVRKWEK